MDFINSDEKITIDNDKNELKTSILIVDSRNRDMTTFPNPNKYTYNLIEYYKRIVEVELLYAYIPKTKCLITSHNNEIVMSIDQMTPHKIYIPTGNYHQNVNSDIYKNLDKSINSITSKFSSDISNIKCVYNYNYKKFFFYNISLNHIQSFSLDFKGQLIETFETNSVHKRVQGVDTVVKEKFLLESNQLYKENSMGYVLGFKPEIYQNTEIKCHFELETNPNVVKITCESLRDFELLYFTITNDDPLLSRILISNSSDFSTNTYLINFNPEIIIDDLGTNQPSLHDINSHLVSSNYINKYKIHDYDKTNKWIVLSNSLQWFQHLNNQLGYIRFCFIEAPNIPNLDKDPYVLLQIDQFDRLDSKNTTIQNSYELIPFSDSLSIFDNNKNYGNIKKFVPVLSVLDKLTISFKDFYGNLYDFMGQEHCMAFAVTYFNRYN